LPLGSCCSEYIYKPHVFSHLAATSSAECNHCSPLHLRLWAAVDNVTSTGSCHNGTSVAARPHFERMRSRFGWSGSNSGVPSSERLGRSKPGCWTLGSSTREELTTGADFHSSRHWQMMSVGRVSVQRAYVMAGNFTEEHLYKYVAAIQHAGLSSQFIHYRFAPEWWWFDV